MSLLLLLAIGFSVSIALFLAERRALRPYLERRCQGFEWKRAFPQANADDIRSFLDVFVEAFAFSKSDRLKFSPSDGILQIYCARNSGGLADSLELESLAVTLERRFQFNLEQSWRASLTLGELFGDVRQRCLTNRSGGTTK